MRRITATLLCFLLAASAQQAPPPRRHAQDGIATFTSTAQLVVEIVTVKDKNGKPIEGLTAKDFTVTEDGVPQTIKFFEFQKLTEAAGAPRRALAARPAARRRPRRPPSVTQNQIAPETPGDIRYRDRRLLALYFDMSAMPPPDQLRAFAAAQKFVTHADDPGRPGGDHGVLRAAPSRCCRISPTIATCCEAPSTRWSPKREGLDENDADDSAADTGAAFGQNDGEFNIFNTDRQLSALQTAAKMLGTLNEKKSLIYFASGLRLNGVDNQAQLRATINAAIRANVSFYPVDARGLVAQAPLGDATRGSPGGVGMYSGGGGDGDGGQFPAVAGHALRAGGGHRRQGAARLQRSLAWESCRRRRPSRVTTSSATTPPIRHLDGKFRKIKITLKEYPSAKLDYRQGYYAGKEFAKFTTADKERQLEDALMLGDPITELTIAMEVNYFQLNRAEYFVPVVVKIPGSELALARRGGAERTLIDFIGEIKDEYGTTIQNVRDKVDIKLSGETAAAAGEAPDPIRHRLHAAARKVHRSSSWRATPRPGESERI